MHRRMTLLHVRMGLRRPLRVLLLVALLLSTATPARAQSPGVSPAAAGASADAADALAWRWRRHAFYDYMYTGALVGTAVFELALPVGEELGERRRAGGVLFDDVVRDALVLGSNDDRHAVGSISDATMGLLVSYPFIVDAALVAWAAKRSPDVALQMSMINIQSLAMASLMTGVTKRIVDRERPVATACFDDPGYDEACDTADKHYSFPSGHTSMAFTGASLICLHHFELELYGDSGDTIACAAAMTMGTLTGVSRIAADKHYLTDVLAGAAIGGISGGLMPWLLYHAWATPPSADESLVTPVVTAEHVGLAWSGTL